MARCLLFPVLCCTVAIALAQDAPAPTFRAGTKLVQVEVVASHRGSPATGLNKEDFTLLDNGKKQTIAFFSVRSLTSASQTAPPLPPGTVSNRVPGSAEAAGHTILLLLDQMNTPEDMQAYAIPRMLKFVQSRPPQDRIGIYTLRRDGTLYAVQELTSDRELLKRSAALLQAHDPNQRTTDMGGMTRHGGQSYAAMNIEIPADAVQAAMEQIGRHLAAIPGRKTLVWISTAFPLYNLALGIDFRPEMEKAARSLNSENVALYAVDARGLMGALDGLTAVTTAETPGRFRSPRGAAMAMGRGEPVNPRGLDTEQELARLTGGEAFFNKSNAIEESIAAAVNDGDLTYTLGFYPDQSEQDGRWHDLKVEVHRSGVGLRYRRNYFAQRESDAANDRPALAQLLAETLDASQIGLRASTVPDSTQPGAQRIKINLDLHDVAFKHEDSKRSGAVDLTFYFSGTAKVLTRTLNIVIPDDQYAGFLERGLDTAAIVDPTGTETVRVIAQDKTTGAAGSITVPFPAK
jgi:VWFA-related protein